MMYDVCIMYNVYIYIYIMLINDYNMLVTDAKIRVLPIELWENIQKVM